MESWYKMFCSCGKANWVCSGGDTNDFSGVDTDAIKCWSCGKIFPVDEFVESDIWKMTNNGPDGEYKTFEEFLKEGAWVENGLQFPN